MVNNISINTFKNIINKYNDNKIDFQYIYNIVCDNDYKKPFFATELLKNKQSYHKMNDFQRKLLINIISQCENDKYSWEVFTKNINILTNDESIILLHKILYYSNYDLTFFISQFNSEEIIYFLKNVKSEYISRYHMPYQYIFDNINNYNFESQKEILDIIISINIRAINLLYDYSINDNIKQYLYNNYHNELLNDVRRSVEKIYNYCLFFYEYLCNNDKDILIDRLIGYSCLDIIMKILDNNMFLLSQNQIDKLESFIVLNKLM